MSFYDLTKEERKQKYIGIQDSIDRAIGNKDLDEMTLLFDHEDIYFRKAAYLAIGKIYSSKPKVLGDILQCLEQLFLNKSERIRQTVINSCGEIAMYDFESVKEFFDNAMVDDHHSVRNAVVGSLKKAGEKNPEEILPYCKANIVSSNPEIRRLSCHGLELRGREHPQEAIEVHGRYEKFSEFTQDFVFAYFQENKINISAQAIENLLDEIEENKMEVHSLIVSKQGKIACEAYWGPYAMDVPHIMYSVSKTFAATIIGILYYEGLVDLHKPLIEYFPQYAHLATGYMKELTLHHLLSMNGGTDCATTKQICCNADKPDWAANFFEDQLIHQPGTHFEYNTPGSYMLCRTAMEITGIKPLEFLNDRLFTPMDIAGVEWDECPLGCNIGGWGMWMKSEDLLKVGLLYLNKGVYNGKRLLSEEWIDKLSSFHSDSRKPNDPTQIGYGYQVWLNSTGGFRMYGMYGQYCFVIPEKEMVVVTTGGMDNPNKLADAVLRMIDNSDGKTTQEEAIRLKQRLASLQTAPLSISGIPQVKSGEPMVFELEPNADGYKALEFTFHKDGGILTLVYNKEKGGHTCVLPFGYGKWKEGTRVCNPEIRQWTSGVKRVVTSGQWNENILTLELRFYETAFAQQWECHISEDKLIVNIKQNCGNQECLALRLLGYRLLPSK